MNAIDEKSLLRAILENPHDDNARLVYADYLQENGQEARAEFIRMQCKYTEDGLEYPTSQLTNYKEWFPDFWQNCTITPPSGEGKRLGGTFLVVRNGFIDEVYCTLETFVGGDCRTCDGYGEDIVTGEVCQSCKGTSEITGIASKLFSTQPITKVVITDVLEPGYSTHYGLHGEYKWGWQSESIRGINLIAQHLPTPKSYALYGMRWKDKKEAMEAFYHGCLNYGRSVAVVGYKEEVCRVCSGEGCSQHGHGDVSKRCDGSGRIQAPINLLPILPEGRAYGENTNR